MKHSFTFHPQQQLCSQGHSPNKLNVMNNSNNVNNNTSLKQSILITNTSSEHSSQPFLQLQRHYHPSRVQKSLQNHQPFNFIVKAQNPTTYQNSLAIRQQQPITVAKSMIQLNINNKQHQQQQQQNTQHRSQHQLSLNKQKLSLNKQKSVSISSQNNSLSKRKKFISITQRSCNSSNARSYYSQQKLTSTSHNISNSNTKTNTNKKKGLLVDFSSTKVRDEKQEVPKQLNTQQKQQYRITNSNNQNNQFDSNNKHNNPRQGFNLKQFITPTKSLKQYLSSVINTISRHVSEKQQNQQQNQHQRQQQQHVLDQDDIIVGNNQTNNNIKNFSSAEKAKLQRNQIKSTFLLHQKQLSKQFRIYTETNQYNQKNNNKFFHKDHNKDNKDKHILLTQPNHHPSDSRNFMVFQQKIGGNTLTRKDSLILALMEQHQNPHEDKQMSSKRSLHHLQQQFSPLKLQTPTIRTKKSFSLIQLTTQIPQFILHEKLKEKTQSHQQQRKPSSTLITTTNDTKQKQQKIKFISLMEKQQSLRYKNCIDQNVIKDQFINLQNKKSQKIKQCS